MPQLLSEAQVEGYARDGYVSPIDVLNQVEVKAFRQELEDWKNSAAKPSIFLKSQRAICCSTGPISWFITPVFWMRLKMSLAPIFWCTTPRFF